MPLSKKAFRPPLSNDPQDLRIALDRINKKVDQAITELAEVGNLADVALTNASAETAYTTGGGATTIDYDDWDTNFAPAFNTNFSNIHANLEDLEAKVNAILDALQSA